LKAIGFDLDNTLYNQRQYEYCAFWLIAVEVEKYFSFDKDQYFLCLKRLFDSGVREYTFDKSAKLCMGEIPEKWEDFVKIRLLPIYRSAKPKLKPFPWIKDLLKDLQENGVKLSLITNGNVDIQKHKIKVLGLKGYFDKIYISDAYNPPIRKPNTGLFKCFLRDFDLDAENVLYIGDDVKIDKSCESLGIKFLHCDGSQKFIKEVQHIMISMGKRKNQK